MTTLYTLTNKSTLKEIAAMLAEDGYDSSLARRVKDAFNSGTLVWTTSHLKFTDRQGPDTYYPRREEDEE